MSHQTSQGADTIRPDQDALVAYLEDHKLVFPWGHRRADQLNGRDVSYLGWVNRLTGGRRLYHLGRLTRTRLKVGG